MSYWSDSFAHVQTAGVPQANSADVLEQSSPVDLEELIEDYPWVRRDEVLTIDGHRFFV